MTKIFFKKHKLFYFLNSRQLVQPLSTLINSNKQRYFGYVCLFLLCLLFVSCTSVNVQKELNGQKFTMSDNCTPVAQITTYNYGYKLFSLIPLCGGNPTDSRDFTLFKNTVTVKNMTDVLMDKSKELGADSVINLTSRTKNMPTVASLFTCTFVEVQVSGNAVKSN